MAAAVTDLATRYSSRKFILSLVVFVVASAFLVAGLITSADWMKLATAILTLYGLANVAQKIGTKPATTTTEAIR